jgi:hypothetical protein
MPSSADPAPADFGSAAGELAVLACGVGLCATPAPVLLALEGPAADVEAVVTDLCGLAPAVGGAVTCGETWWCGVAPGRVLVIGVAATAMLLRGRLDWHLVRRRELSLCDLGAECAVLQIAGARVGELLAELGVFGASRDPRRVAPVRRAPVAGADALWVLRADHDALAVVMRDDLAAVRAAIDAAGRPLKLAAVGRDAVARYALARRRAGAVMP